jgi:hypothetical protein
LIDYSLYLGLEIHAEQVVIQTRRILGLIDEEDQLARKNGKRNDRFFKISESWATKFLKRNNFTNKRHTQAQNKKVC